MFLSQNLNIYIMVTNILQKEEISLNSPGTVVLYPNPYSMPKHGYLGHYIYFALAVWDSFSFGIGIGPSYVSCVHMCVY